MEMNDIKAAEAALIADLEATFPGVHARALSDPKWSGSSGFTRGVRIAGEAVMPDGLPMLCTLACPDPDEYYDGEVHLAFIAWLKARGWSLECWDCGIHYATRDEWEVAA